MSSFLTTAFEKTKRVFDWGILSSEAKVNDLLFTKTK